MGRWIAGITAALTMLVATGLFVILALTCVDVVGRYFGHPVFGSVELVIFMAALATGLALPYTHAVKGHIGVEVFVRLLSIRAQQVIELCTNTACLGLMGLISWQMLVYAETMKASGQVSMNLELPEHLVILALAFCFVVFSLLIVKEIVVNSIAILKDVFGGPVPDARGGR